MPSYYRNWDKVDVEAEAAKIENDESVVFDRTAKNQDKYKGMSEDEIKQKQQEDFMKKTSGAKPHTSMVIKGGSMVSELDKVEIVKSQGNGHFKSQNFDKAIQSYTEAL